MADNYTDLSNTETIVGSVSIKDISGNGITSTADGSKRAIDVHIAGADSSAEVQVEVSAADGDTIGAVQSGTWNITNVSGTVSLPTGASTEATLALIKAKTDNLDVALSTRTKPADSQKVDGSAVTQPVAGPTASGSSLTANPVTGGGLGKTANPTAVSDGQVVNSLHDKLGKQVVVGSLRDLKGNQQTTITSSTAETTIVTADATNFLDLYGIVLTNTSATTTKVTIKDATSGTTRFVFEVPATDTRGFMLTEGAAHKQAANNNNWTATCGTSVASLEVSAMFVKNL